MPSSCPGTRGCTGFVSSVGSSSHSPALRASTGAAVSGLARGAKHHLETDSMQIPCRVAAAAQHACWTCQLLCVQQLLLTAGQEALGGPCRHLLQLSSDSCVCGSCDPLALELALQQLQRQLAHCSETCARPAQACGCATQQQQVQMRQQQQPVTSMDEDDDLDQFLEAAIEQELRSRLAEQPLTADASGCYSQHVTAAVQSDIETMIEQTFFSVTLQGGAEGTAENMCDWACPEAGPALPSSPMSSSSSLLPAMPPAAAAAVNHQLSTMMAGSQVAVQQASAAVGAAAYADHTAVRRQQLLLQAEALLREELLLRQASITSTPAAATAGGVSPCADLWDPLAVVRSSSIGVQGPQAAGSSAAAALSLPQQASAVTPSWCTSLSETSARADGQQAALMEEAVYLDPAAATAAAATFTVAGLVNPQPSRHPEQQGCVPAVQNDTQYTGPTKLKHLQAQACAAASYLHDLQVSVGVLMQECRAHTCT